MYLLLIVQSQKQYVKKNTYDKNSPIKLYFKAFFVSDFFEIHKIK